MSENPETHEETERRLRLEEQCAEVGRVLAARMPKGVGFALLMFDFGSGGNMAWASNAERPDMIEMLHEWLGRQGGA